MTIDQIISAFMMGSRNVKGRASVSIRNGILHSYQIPVAFIWGGTCYVNTTKRSVTTSHLQNEVIRRADRSLYITPCECDEETFFHALTCMERSEAA